MFLPSTAEGAFTATATVCNVDRHNWAGFRMDDYMQDNRYAFVTVYFSHGDSWSGMESSKAFSVTFIL